MAREYRQRSEIEATVSSICRNIAEGFRRGRNREFARFVEYSYSSCAELKSLYEDLEIAGVATRVELRPLRRLRYRLDRALVAFLRHLPRYPTAAVTTPNPDRRVAYAPKRAERATAYDAV